MMDKPWQELYAWLFSAREPSGKAFWLGCTLLLAGIYGALGLRQAFAGDYIVQDDARQHVFWMLRYLDPTLFPKDAIADYFQTVAPAGYRGLYRLAAAIGFNPLVFNQLLPPLLLLLTAGYVFALCLEILPLPVAGFMAATLFNQSLCLEDDLMSATPRAFVYPLLAAFLYYLARRSWLTWAVILLGGLFYPQAVLLFTGILAVSLLEWRQGRLRLLSKSKDYRFFLVGLAVAILVLLPFALSVSAYDPTITAAQARELPEFGVGAGGPVFLVITAGIFGCLAVAVVFFRACC
ncbi:MAG: hypothetical protein HC890_02495 [Chloroflexaceae bacterium]|nr:hypothetical protein [Chloroflexaceae bacterium]